MNKINVKITINILSVLCLSMFLIAGCMFINVKNVQAETTWEENIEVDADSSCFKETENGKIDGYTLRKVVTSNVNNFGLTNYACHITHDDLKVNECIKFELVTPIDTTSLKSVRIKFRYSGGACFYIYPLNSNKLDYNSAVQSFRTKQSIEDLTISTELLAEDNLFKGFIIQLKEGTDMHQFFIDSVTPLKDAFIPPKKEDLRPFEWVEGKESDANSKVFESLPKGTIGKYNSPIISIDDLGRKYPDWGFKDFCTFSATGLEQDMFLKFKFKSAIDVSKIKSLVVNYKYVKDSYFYVYNVDETSLTYENAKQGIMTESGHKSFTLSTEKLAKNGKMEGFIIQLKKKDGAPAQFFIDSVIPKAEEFIAGEVDPLLPFAWKENVEFDVNKDVIIPTSMSDDMIGDKKPLTVYLENLNNFGIKDYGAFCSENMKQGDFLRYKFVHAVDVKEFKSMVIKAMHNSPACFYIYPLNATELTKEQAVQSIRTNGGIEEFTLSTEKLAVNGKFEGFIIELRSEVGVQFFIDSLMVKKQSYIPQEVEDLTPFNWEQDKEYDAMPTIFQIRPSETFEEYNSYPVAVENLESLNIGITGYSAFTVEALKKGMFVPLVFSKPMDADFIKSFTIKYIHNGSACFYVYPLNPLTMEYAGAVQSFRTKGGEVESVTISTENLAENGVVKGFIIQLRTDEGAQFFVDSITTSSKAIKCEKVEELDEAEWKIKNVKINSIMLVREYESGTFQDMLKIQFNRNIFTKQNETLMNLSYLNDKILINGVTLKQAGIGIYALRGVFGQYNELAIFLNNDKKFSLKHDGYDKIEILTGFSIQGSSEDNTLYTVDEDSTWYTNKAGRKGEAINLSITFYPPLKTVNPLLVRLYGGDVKQLEIVFDNDIGENTDESILNFIKVNETLLSEISDVKISVKENVLTITFKMEVTDDITIIIKSGLKTGNQSIVKEDEKYLYQGEEILFSQRNTLVPYWIYGCKQEKDIFSFTVHMSDANMLIEDYKSSSLDNIKIDGVSLNDIEGKRVDLNGNEVVITLPSKFIKDKTKVIFERGFALPSSFSEINTEYTYDADYGEFFIKTDKEMVKDLLKPAVVVSVIRGTDGVEKGTNQIFVEFSVPVGQKYLPYIEADPQTIYTTYGIQGVNVTDRYIYELSLIGVRESVMNNILLDGKSLRELAIADSDKQGEWKRFIDVYCLGTIFNDYTMQIVTGKNSSGVMDFDKDHTLTIKKGFITAGFGFVEEDQNFAWDKEKGKWQLVSKDNGTVDPDAHLREDVEQDVKSGCGSSLQSNVNLIIFMAFTLVITLVLRRKKNA